MVGVDLADQLRGTYRIDKGVRNRKWWWSILFWEIGVMILNAYVMYLKINLENGQKKRICCRIMILGKPLHLRGSIQVKYLQNYQPRFQQGKGRQRCKVYHHSLVVVR